MLFTLEQAPVDTLNKYLWDAQEQCAFNGAWGGGAKPSAFYVSSYFWDRATDAGIIGDKAAITWVLKPNDFSAAASKACSSSVSTLSQHFPNVRSPVTPDMQSFLTSLTSSTKMACREGILSVHAEQGCVDHGV